MPRALVTRPEPGASATAQALAKAGWEPVVLPLTEIRAIPGAADAGDPTVDAVVLTSANAARHAPPGLLARHRCTPVYAVGAATADAARQAGFTAILAGPGDAAGLARMIVGRLRPGAAILYLCGRVRRPELERALAAGAISVVAVETYDTVRSAIGQDAAGRIGPLDAVLVHSAEAALALAELARSPAFGQLLSTARLVAVSGRAAAPLATRFEGRMRVAREPTDAALIEALERLD
jgi:uroporphyrinogen-III synthase